MNKWRCIRQKQKEIHDHIQDEWKGPTKIVFSTCKTPSIPSSSRYINLKAASLITCSLETLYSQHLDEHTQMEENINTVKKKTKLTGNNLELYWLLINSLDAMM